MASDNLMNSVVDMSALARFPNATATSTAGWDLGGNITSVLQMCSLVQV